MDKALVDILDQLRGANKLSPDEVAKIIRSHNAGIHDNAKRASKKKLLRHYFETKNSRPELWRSWNVDDALEAKFLRCLRAKPRRTASGVATITVITKPWPCEGNCVFCPNDLRMPKSYVHNEPACQRAERNFFDPYLQVTSRLRALTQMGHITDKVELIVLGGSWTTYPDAYQRWYISRLFEALNEAGQPSRGAAKGGSDANLAEKKAATLRKCYADAGFTTDDKELDSFVREDQQKILHGDSTYNQAFHALYDADSRWQALAQGQSASWEDVEKQQRINEFAAHRCVGLVVETRPDAISAQALSNARRLGCTKIQIGVQSTCEETLARNGRSMSAAQLTQAFELLRLFGFKTHTHFMANLVGATPEDDAADYQIFSNDPRFKPDEVKLYPCVLLGGTKLEELQNQGKWSAYSSRQLQWLMTQNLMATQPYTRVSRMIRDFSAQDIIQGNRTANLRQIIEAQVARENGSIQEIRHREVGGSSFSPEELTLDVVEYDTTATTEFFLQWVTPENRIAGFLRLSLPKKEALERHSRSAANLPTTADDVMIREVHVYGKVERLHEAQEGTQHLGLGRKLVARACEIAREHERTRIFVISAVGTREYYRKLGFVDNGLYQSKAL
ncbi:MAG: tRNA uridine(34) 5-carboxymethylaminomethyl modification radical SAM/GNAT enzyme Elp3 [Coriobacteriia bacterium]|nr:tRNA uridine(34) 5-carboxymethylaminomethyl modification radical SAM/GNAT enzyme Elp3 [Coriobacteriia bacterium]